MQGPHVVTASMELVLKINQSYETTFIVEEVKEMCLSVPGVVELTVDMNWMSM